MRSGWWCLPRGEKTCGAEGTLVDEATTCQKYVVPRLNLAGWSRAPHGFTEQDVFTDGRIVVAGNTASRLPRKRTDYLLRYAPDLPIAVVEAKANYKTPGAGLQQAKDYAELLGLQFAYATNGAGIVEFDYLTGRERELDAFPTPDELWSRLRARDPLPPGASAPLLTPDHLAGGKTSRYYQRLAIDRAVEAIARGQRRVLLTLATGTGKTIVAFQVCWKLWSARWNREGAHRRPRILFLADRSVLVDDPKDKTFAPFGDARWKIEGGVVNTSRELYFATYQALAEDAGRPGLFRDYPPDFFDLVIVDECHRGSADDESSWRQILEYFAPAAQLGMTATPRRADNAATYRYFGAPVYQYSLKQGIADGFLAPYRVYRIITTPDAAGWRPTAGQLDRYGQAIPDGEYHTKDFERVIALRARTEAIARHLTDYLKRTDRFAKTIVFCVDQEHADEMRRALNNLNTDLTQRYPDYVCRVTSDEGHIGRGHLGRFQDVDTRTPVILTTSQLLTTGVDAPTCRNIVLARVVNSMTEFKQIIGRGTRVREDYGKLAFAILDYTGAATQRFADPEFDGEPVEITTEGEDEQPGKPPRRPPDDDAVRDARTKYYVDDGRVTIATQLVYELDASGQQLRAVELTDFTAGQVRTLYATADQLRAAWASPTGRPQLVAALRERGIDFALLAEAAGRPDADPFDLLCHVAFDAPLLTRHERAERLRRDRRDFFDHYGPDARAILDDLLDKYTQYGAEQFTIPDVLKVPPLSDRGNVGEIAALFGGAAQLKDAVEQLQALLYAA